MYVYAKPHVNNDRRMYKYRLLSVLDHFITNITDTFFQESTKIPSSAVLAVISKHFLKMQEADSPLDKLENLLAAISVMFNSVRTKKTFSYFFL